MPDRVPEGVTFQGARCGMSQVNSSSRGFTLIELLVVLAIIGILSGVGAYQLTPKSKPLVRQLTEQLFLTINEARQLARTSGQPITLRVRGNTPSTLSIDLEYPRTNPNATLSLPPPRFDMATQPTRLRDSAVPGIGRIQIDSVGASLANIKSLGLVPDFDGLISPENSLFQGIESTAFSFSNAGMINQSVFITVSSPTANRESPLALIIVTPMNGAHAFYLEGPNAPWRRI